jgi:hypothetical protein
LRYEIDTGEETKLVNPEDVARLIFSKMKGTAQKLITYFILFCNFLKIFIIYLHVPVYVSVSVHCLRLETSPETGIRSSCELLEVGAGN